MKEFMNLHPYLCSLIVFSLGFTIGWIVSGMLLKEPRKVTDPAMTVIRSLIIMPITLLFCVGASAQYYDTNNSVVISTCWKTTPTADDVAHPVWRHTSYDSFPTKGLKPLGIGDKVPNIEFTNEDGTKFHLNDFKSEAVLLDFWASWCGSCIARWSGSDSIKEHHKDKMNIILISTAIGEKGEADSAYRRLKKYASRITHLKYRAMEDTMAYNLFFPRVLPYYVWLKRDLHDQVPEYYVNGFTSGGISLDELIQWAYMEDLKPKKK